IDHAVDHQGVALDLRPHPLLVVARRIRPGHLESGDVLGRDLGQRRIMTSIVIAEVGGPVPPRLREDLPRLKEKWRGDEGGAYRKTAPGRHTYNVRDGKWGETPRSVAGRHGQKRFKIVWQQ